MAIHCHSGTGGDNGDLSESAPHYESKFQNWYQVASVRAKPRRVVKDEERDAPFFPSELVPVSLHPEIVRLGPKVQKEITTRHLYRYLEFTTKLEVCAVNPITLAVARNDLGIGLPNEMMMDAWKLYCDEAYHALFSEDLKQQTCAVTGIKPVLPADPSFLTRLKRLQSGLDEPRLRRLALHFFVVVSETLISASLAQLPKNSVVVSAVKEVVSDHAEDEGRHHAFYARYLDILCQEISSEDILIMGKLVPEFILAFLMPDTTSILEELQCYGIGSQKGHDILQEVYQVDVIEPSIRQACKSTVSHFRRNGVIEHPEVMGEFVKAGIL